MDEWKKDFEAKHGREWVFQNSELEDEYKAFCDEKAKSDPVLAESRKIYEQELADAKQRALDE
jgi:hypothetical protein